MNNYEQPEELNDGEICAAEWIDEERLDVAPQLEPQKKESTVVDVPSKYETVEAMQEPF